MKDSSQPTVFTDQMGRTITIPFPPQRIISLVPSQTELLFYLGLDEEVVGITKFCIHPEKQFRKKPRIGGTKQLNLDQIAALQPDLIIGNKEENTQSQIEELTLQYPVWMSDIKTLDDALDMIGRVGQLVGKTAKATHLQEKLHIEFSSLIKHPISKRAAYFIWQKPYMVAAADTFIDNMLSYAGFKNVFGNKTRYPEVQIEDLQAAAPEVILLSSEPFPFSEKHFPALQKICPDAIIQVVDGELFSWYGNRLLLAPAYFSKLR